VLSHSAAGMNTARELIVSAQPGLEQEKFQPSGTRKSPQRRPRASCERRRRPSGGRKARGDMRPPVDGAMLVVGHDQLGQLLDLVVP
jgi:hypothetical protein